MQHIITFLRHPITRRLIEAGLTLIGVSVLTFVLLRVVPGNQITAAYGTATNDLSSGQIQSLEAYYGLDKPLIIQYFTWVQGVLTGNLGISTTSHMAVSSMTASALPNTVELAVFSILIAVIIGVPGGMLAASRPGSARDGATQIASLLALSVPSFLLATLLATWLTNSFGWYPNGEGYQTLLQNPGLNLEQMLLPALVLGISIASPVVQTTRTAILEIRGSDYIRTAQAKGLSSWRVEFAHILRNALIPVTTMTGMQFGFLLGGAVVIEQIFAIPGLGRQVFLGLQQKDYAVVQSTVLIIAVIFVVVNLFTDLLYRIIDPKVRAE